MICLTKFDSRAGLLAVLGEAGLLRGGEPDASVVDAFPVYPRVFGTVDGVEGWRDDMTATPGWTANLVRWPDEDTRIALLPWAVEPPAHPRRVFA